MFKHKANNTLTNIMSIILIFSMGAVGTFYILRIGFPQIKPFELLYDMSIGVFGASFSLMFAEIFLLKRREIERTTERTNRISLVKSSIISIKRYFDEINNERKDPENEIIIKNKFEFVELAKEKLEENIDIFADRCKTDSIFKQSEWRFVYTIIFFKKISF